MVRLLFFGLSASESVLRKYPYINITGIFVTGFIGAYHIGRSSKACSGGTEETVGGNRYSDDGIAPEGAIHGSFSLTHDFRGRKRYIKTQDGAVASDHGRCADQGVDIMRKGGNAVDAAVVTALCQGIYNPMASGLGGGHIMVLRYVLL